LQRLGLPSGRKEKKKFCEGEGCTEKKKLRRVYWIEEGMTKSSGAWYHKSESKGSRRSEKPFAEEKSPLKLVWGKFSTCCKRKEQSQGPPSKEWSNKGRERGNREFYLELRKKTLR